jgi:hypothetical protein
MWLLTTWAKALMVHRSKQPPAKGALLAKGELFFQSATGHGCQAVLACAA